MALCFPLFVITFGNGIIKPQGNLVKLDTQKSFFSFSRARANLHSLAVKTHSRLGS